MADPSPKRPPKSQDEEHQPSSRTSAGQPPAKHRPPSNWRDVAEEAIEEAIRSGAFDDLPGQGKPLNLISNPYAPGTELAYQLLKDNQYTLPWISERASLLARMEDLREEITRSWTAQQGAYRGASDHSQRLDLDRAWATLLATWEETIASLNKDIATLNLKQPGDQLEILKLTLNNELDRAGARRALG